MAAPIVIAIGLDTGDAQAAAEKLAQAIRSALDGLGPAAQRAGEKAGDALTKGFANSLKTFQRQISDVGQQLSLKVSLPLSGVGLAALKAAADLDKSRQTLTALTGSIESANRKLAELRELARSSPGVTTQFATSLFAQFKALGTVSDQSINSIIKSLGRLNAVFTLPDPAQFARNLQQIFSQGFERADIKEALGQVPIFEQLLEQAFGTKDAAKLRALKEAGKLTVGGFFDGIGEAINQRFPQVSESILARFQKTKDEVLVALAPLGESLIRTLEPVLLKVIPKIIELLDRFAKLPPAVQEGIIIFGLLTAALGPVLAAFGSLLQIVTSLTALISGAAGLTVAIGALNPVLLIVGGTLAAGALGWYAYSSAVKNATDQIDIAVRKQQESVGVFKNLQGQTTTRSGNVIPEGARDLFNQMPTGGLAPGERVSLGGLTAGQFNPATGRFEGQQQAVRAGLADSIKTVNDKAIQDAKQ
ncbi:MAG: hypothetical protein EBR82_63100, partial [Caulobacteraceae bacterium]|nr:hypothetical protein [Caulobacteraceae bacterium]